MIPSNLHASKCLQPTHLSLWEQFFHTSLHKASAARNGELPNHPTSIAFPSLHKASAAQNGDVSRYLSIQSGTSPPSDTWRRYSTANRPLLSALRKKKEEWTKKGTSH